MLLKGREARRLLVIALTAFLGGYGMLQGTKRACYFNSLRQLTMIVQRD